jgi:hypothetical protein
LNTRYLRKIKGDQAVKNLDSARRPEPTISVQDAEHTGGARGAAGIAGVTARVERPYSR